MDIQRIRRDTPGCADKLFLNSAGSSLPPHTVVAAMKQWLEREEEIGGYDLAALEPEQRQGFYNELALMLNARPGQIAYMPSATDAYMRALSAIPFNTGDFILTTTNDYVSNQIVFLSLQKRLGVQLIRARNLPNGDLDLGHLEELMKRHQPKLVSLSHIPTSSGLVQPAEAVGALCKKYGIWYLLDACQSAGQLDLNVEQLGCDFLSATGRKFMRGPRGTGFLYAGERVMQEGLEPLMIDMGGADWTGADSYRPAEGARRFEYWEIPYAAMIGLAEAARYANALGMAHIEARNRELMDRLRTNLAPIPRIRLLDQGSRLSNILTFQMDGMDLPELKERLQASKISFSVTTRGSAWIDFSDKGIEWAVRFSPHYFNTLEEMDEVGAILGTY